MSTHDKQSPVMLEDLLADGELTLAELARIIGGADPFAASTTTPLTNPLLPDPFAPLPQTTAAQLNTGTGSIPNSAAMPTIDFSAANKDVLLPGAAKVDSAYTSHIGATGTSGNEASTHMKHIPLNMTTAFP